jgi:hypothetical protein
MDFSIRKELFAFELAFPLCKCLNKFKITRLIVIKCEKLGHKIANSITLERVELTQILILIALR